jgi:hypothetical protein
MSLFHYPRINFKGEIQLNPGTANNDDYAQQPSFVLPPNGPYAGQPLALIDSKTVRPQTYGMSDSDYISWVQTAQTFINTANNSRRQIIPAEWNYYGDMKSQTIGPITIIGIQTGPDRLGAEVNPGDSATRVIGSSLSYSGRITDVNSEGSPPATQFFIDSLTLTKAAETFLSGAASKGVCQWLNFYRNVNLTGDGGSGGYVYHVMKKSDQLPGFEDPKIIGVICRYYLYRRSGGASSNADIEALYKNHQKNPATLEIVGTLAPLYADERIVAGPVGRLLISNNTPIPTPPGSKNNGNSGIDADFVQRTYVALAPAVLQQNGDIISVDFSGTFPDNFDGESNPKYDFGPASLMVANAGESTVIGPVNYADTDAGDRRGWIFDFDISTNAAAQRILRDPDARFSLRHAQYGTILAETDYYFVSNQQAIYAEQGGAGDMFLNQGTTEPATLSVYHRGRELAAAECPPITVWQYRSVPIQSPGDVEKIATNFKPGQRLRVDTSQPGNFLLTFSIEPDGRPALGGFPPSNYNTYMYPPYLTNAPSISVRILPNDEDFSRYYSDPSAEEPVGNDQLTFDVVYQKVLRTYYLLYPAMNKRFQLNSEVEVTDNAQAILGVTNPQGWMSIGYMPPTRDMSESRRKLLQAWCRKVLKARVTA